MIYVKGTVKLIDKGTTSKGKDFYTVKVLDEKTYDSIAVVSYERDAEGKALKPSVPLNIQDTLILVEPIVFGDKAVLLYRGYEPIIDKKK